MAVWTVGLPGLEIQIQTPESVSTATRHFPQPILVERDPGVVEVHQPCAGRKLPPMPRSRQLSQQDPVEAQPQRPSRQVFGAMVGVANSPLVVWCFGVALLVLGWRLPASDSKGRCELCRPRRRTLPLRSGESPPRWVAVARSKSEFRGNMPCRSGTGLRRPLLVLPERMCQIGYRGQLPAVIAHELAHVRSWDFGWNAALQAISTMLWFHPLAWRIGSVHRAACDAVCDAVAASYLGDVRAIAGRSRRWRWRPRQRYPSRACPCRGRAMSAVGSPCFEEGFAAALGPSAVFGVVLDRIACLWLAGKHAICAGERPSGRSCARRENSSRRHRPSISMATRFHRTRSRGLGTVRYRAYHVGHPQGAGVFGQPAALSGSRGTSPGTWVPSAGGTYSTAKSCVRFKCPMARKGE